MVYDEVLRQAAAILAQRAAEKLRISQARRERDAAKAAAKKQ